MGEIIDKVKDKVKDVKDAVVNTTKDVADKTKDTVDPSSSSSSSSTTDRAYSSSSSSTDVDRKYEEGGPGTPSKINEHEPTAIRRDPRDQNITSGGQTGTAIPEAQEQYRKKGMTKVDTESSADRSQDGSTNTTTLLPPPPPLTSF